MRSLWGFAMRPTFVAVALALLSIAARGATVDTAAALYANTLVVRDQGTGSQGFLQLNSDGTFTAEVSQNGHPLGVSGTWKLMADGTTICLTQTSAGAQPTPFTSGCSPLAGHNVGDRWFAANDQNQALDLALRQGR